MSKFRGLIILLHIIDGASYFHYFHVNIFKHLIIFLFKIFQISLLERRQSRNVLEKGHFKQRQYHRGGLFCVTTGQRTSWTFKKEFLTYNITQNNICNSNALISYTNISTLPDFYFKKCLRLVFLQKMLLIFIQLNFINATGAICFIYCFHHHYSSYAMT